MKKQTNLNSRTLFSLPYLFFMTLFVVVPLIMLLYYAFFNGGFSFTEVTDYFTDPVQWATIIRSLRIAFIAALVCVLIGYPLAYIISRMKSKQMQGIVLVALIAPMWVNGLLRTIAVKEFATMLGIPNGEFLLIIGLIMDYLPFMIMPVYLVLSGISKSYYEVSADLGAGPVTTFTQVVLPLSMPGIISGFLMVFTPAVSTYYMSEFLGDTSTWMIGEQLNLMFAKYDNKSGAAIIALVLLAIVGLSVVLTNKLSKIGTAKGEND